MKMAQAAGKLKSNGNWKAFKVQGWHVKNKESDDMTRGQIIQNNVRNTSTFELEREPDNPYDENAIKIYLKSRATGRVQIGYVPRAMAAEWAPLMDQTGWMPRIIFGMKFIREYDGRFQGLQLRYAVR